MQTVTDVQVVEGTRLSFVTPTPIQTFHFRPADPAVIPAPREPVRRDLRGNIIQPREKPERKHLPFRDAEPPDEDESGPRPYRTMDEIAEILGITKQAVEQTLKKALAKLRVALTQPIDPDPLLPPIHFVHAYGIRQKDLHAARKAGLLTGQLDGKNWRYRESEVQRWRASLTPSASPSPA